MGLEDLPSDIAFGRLPLRQLAPPATLVHFLTFDGDCLGGRGRDIGDFRTGKW